MGAPAVAAATPPTLEERVAALESSNLRVAEMIVGVLEGLQSLHRAMFALGLWMQTQTEALPGEDLPGEPARPN